MRGENQGAFGALSVLREAIRSTPATSWAMGVAGLAAASVVVYGLTGSGTLAFLGIAGVLISMVALFVFSRIVVLTKAKTNMVAAISLWFLMIVVMAAFGLLFSSVFMDQPWRLRTVAERSLGLPPRATERPISLITAIPRATECLGPSVLGSIRGKVRGVSNPDETKVVLYAYCQKWYVQPTTDHPWTDVDREGSWSNTTHLGMSYAAVVVNASYKPSPETDALPQVGGGVIAVGRVDLDPIAKE